jgi:cysteine synthase A
MDISLLIGNTPLLSLDRFFPAGGLYGKAEWQNLTGSIKDRPALEILRQAAWNGLLPPGGTVIEPTSGNMGISLAALAGILGYRCILTMPENMSRERQQLMTAYGARVVLTPAQAGMQGAVEQARLLAAQTKGSFLADQFSNPANVLAHYRTTGAELWQQSGGKLDWIVAGVGTGGTVTGIARFWREQGSHVRIAAVEPAESPLLSVGRTGSHGIQGIGANFVPKLLELSLIDRIIPVREADARASARLLAQTEGLLCGISSGAALHAARLLAQPGQQIAVILPDSGSRYLSEKLFSENDP